MPFHSESLHTGPAPRVGHRPPGPYGRVGRSGVPPVVPHPEGPTGGSRTRSVHVNLITPMTKDSRERSVVDE